MLEDDKIEDMKNQYARKRRRENCGLLKMMEENRMAHGSGTSSRESEVSVFTEINYGTY